jgi:hypothetical protein
MTNFDAHYDMCAVERLPDVVAVRQSLFEAKKLHEQKAIASALPKYKSALAAWLNILLDHHAFRQLGEIQVETYEHQWHYLELLQDQQKQKQILAKVIEGMARLGDWSLPMAQPKAMVNELLLGLAHREKVDDAALPRPDSDAGLAVLLGPLQGFGPAQAVSPLLSSSVLATRQKVRLVLIDYDDKGNVLKKYNLDGTSMIDYLKVIKPSLRLTPLRRVHGPLELLYTSDESDAAAPSALQWLTVSKDLLRGLTVVPALPVPDTDTADKNRVVVSMMGEMDRPKEWHGVTVIYLADGKPPADWHPLLRPDWIAQARVQMRLERASPPAKSPKTAAP